MTVSDSIAQYHMFIVSQLGTFYERFVSHVVMRRCDENDNVEFCNILTFKNSLFINFYNKLVSVVVAVRCARCR